MRFYSEPSLQVALPVAAVGSICSWVNSHVVRQYWEHGPWRPAECPAAWALLRDGL